MTWRPSRALAQMVALLLLGWVSPVRAGELLTIDPNHAGHKKAGVECLTCHETIFDQTALGQPGAFPGRALGDYPGNDHASRGEIRAKARDPVADPRHRDLGCQPSIAGGCEGL